jgi:hypothetical protein
MAGVRDRTQVVPVSFLACSVVSRMCIAHVRQLALLLAVVTSIVSCTSCNGNAPLASRSPASPARTASSAQGPARQGCPVTKAVRHATPPASIDATGPKPVPYVYDWFGNDALWVRLPLLGNLPAMRDPALGAWATKFPWWRIIPGALTITARRLDGPTGHFSGNPGTVDSYGTAGFDPSYLVWPSLGCWQVTGTVANQSLTIVMHVQAQR